MLALFFGLPIAVLFIAWEVALDVLGMLCRLAVALIGD